MALKFSLPRKFQYFDVYALGHKVKMARGLAESGKFLLENVQRFYFRTFLREVVPIGMLYLVGIEFGQLVFPP